MKNNSNANGRKKADQVTRKCVACGSIKPKAELVRIVRSRKGEIAADLTGRANGRGAYICRTDECIRKAISSRALNRSFKCDIDKDHVESLLSELI